MVNLPKEEVPKDIPLSTLVRQVSAGKVQDMIDRMEYIVAGNGTVYLTNLIEAADLVVHNAKMLQIPNLYQKTLNFLRSESNLVSLIYVFVSLLYSWKCLKYQIVIKIYIFKLHFSLFLRIIILIRIPL